MATSCGPVVGMTSTAVTVDLAIPGMTSGSMAVLGSVEATPWVFSSAFTIAVRPAASPGLGSSTATKNGPLTPAPKPSVVRS